MNNISIIVDTIKKFGMGLKCKLTFLFKAPSRLDCGKRKAPSFYIGEKKRRLCRIRSISATLSGKLIVAKEMHKTVWRRSHGKLAIFPAKEPNPHIIITGASGFGKSTLLKSILREISGNGLPALLFDPQNEHEPLVREIGGKIYNARFNSINLLALDGLSIRERIAELSDTLCEVYSLGQIQRAKLSKCLWYCYMNRGAMGMDQRILEGEPSLRDLQHELSVFIKNSKSAAERNSLIPILERVRLLATPEPRQCLKIGDIRSGINSISFASIGTREERLIYITEIAKRLYYLMHTSEVVHSPKFYIVIDEAQAIMGESGRNSGMISSIIEEGRKYGFGTIMVVHGLSQLDKAIPANASTIIAFHSSEPTELAYISRLLSGGDAEAARLLGYKISTLRINRALIKTSSMEISEFELSPKRLGRPIAMRESNSLGKVTESLKYPIKESEIAILESPGAEELPKIGSTIDCYYGFGAKWFMLRKNPSIEHQVCVRQISRILSASGIANRIMGGPLRPDLAASMFGVRIAIEYETGKKKFLESRAMVLSRLLKYDIVVVVVNDFAEERYGRIRSKKVIVLPAGRMAEMPGTLATACGHTQQSESPRKE
ncbi:MAG: DUF87 domain-containing protein [Candidatus Micrarchaeales archaeon]|jgi:hypothetical protein|uniref:AAA ATPase n=1 Tax=Candidatus Micrarchaeum acidiphilum ARMAN-2 TaxID=425595 RepID=C7DIJ8_MICA2|nr:MAG: AAA ATPase [Candidatus Micrarchaeum acidiphilum ARMAN-2]MCW6161027.1 DUF87 domain-containing protein [Candidatus Micrarchaeales archaeon]